MPLAASTAGPSWKTIVAAKPAAARSLLHKTIAASAMYTIRGEKIAASSRAPLHKANGIYIARENDKTVVRINPVY